MNPLKCAFGVSAGQFWRFVVHRNVIEVDPSKIKTILEMAPPTPLKQLMSLMGKISYIRSFIPNLSKKVKPRSVLMKKGVEFVWSEECQKAFQAMKNELLSPPVLMADLSSTICPHQQESHQSHIRKQGILTKHIEQLLLFRVTTSFLIYRLSSQVH